MNNEIKCLALVFAGLGEALGEKGLVNNVMLPVKVKNISLDMEEILKVYANTMNSLSRVLYDDVITLIKKIEEATGFEAVAEKFEEKVLFYLTILGLAYIEFDYLPMRISKLERQQQNWISKVDVGNTDSSVGINLPSVSIRQKANIVFKYIVGKKGSIFGDKYTIVKKSEQTTVEGTVYDGN